MPYLPVVMVNGKVAFKSLMRRDFRADVTGGPLSGGAGLAQMPPRPDMSGRPESNGHQPAEPPPVPAKSAADALGHESHHRITNSVQIIASILQQSLRDTVSPEARREIEAAHHRIMAVASLQRSFLDQQGDIALDPYLQGIGHRIAQALLDTGGRVAITVSCPPVTVASTTATSIGLVVTELLINAIKHAFPDARHGCIHVAFQRQDAGWTLRVTDDGVGRPATDHKGFGSRIILALAQQLDAQVSEPQSACGTCTVLHHDPRGQMSPPCTGG